ncbi:MAG: hypothetical protein DRJ03_04075 [Chloroflexi bacterium]|nr:MAG: hypothetical protein DRJ03_04075 [Chloroflexota bacterium]
MSLTLTIPYKPHPGQKLFHKSKARFRILACGRRWGKTICGANEAIRQATKSPPGSVGFCVAPTYWHTQKMWREFLRFCPRVLIVEINRADHHIRLVGDRHVWFKSADNPDSLRSEGLDWLWMDEGGQIKEEAWDLALRPALMDRKGVAWFTGTPKGKNWYFRLWTRGQDPAQKDYESWTFPSHSNPYLDPKEIEDFARDMPELALRQEIYAQFIEDVGSVFRGVEECVKGSLEPPVLHKTYVMGADLAKHQDFTVLCVLDNDGHLCAFDRFSELDWVFQRRRIVNLAQRYKARLLIDSTGVGDPVLDELRRNNVKVEGYKFTSASKKDLIENLSILIDNRKISFPDIPELVNELKLYGYTTTPSGTIRYGAPEGYHDDCVIALALAAWQVSRPRGYFV